MVVVAIMSILATMGVANFGSAIARARNAVRQNDMMAISKSMETCFNMTSGIYWGAPSTCGADEIVGGKKTCALAGKIIEKSSSGTQLETPYSSLSNACLDQDLLPKMDNHPYYIEIDNGTPQDFIVCAELEYAAGVEILANYQAGDLTGGPGFTTDIRDIVLSNEFIVDCKGTSVGGTADPCWFCVRNAQ
jgi:type II secretory pathway pseudopilin PulG